MGCVCEGMGEAKGTWNTISSVSSMPFYRGRGTGLRV